ncbi:hypothetical protein QQP08_018386 [Theobroma cacao]|nr:hypothetical protein QQP08_018386 [Theobroma cacao]
MVLPKCGTKKIPVEVNASDNVAELRKELQKLQQRLQFHLPQEGLKRQDIIKNFVPSFDIYFV